MHHLLEETIRGIGENYIFPFFWQHGETEEILREYMGAIADCGIREVCVEARGHEEYVGPKWWRDLDVILDEAKKRGMRIWILDDAHFPTGQAAGEMKHQPDSRRKLYLAAECVEAAGPLSQVQIPVTELSRPKAGEPWFQDDCLAAVTACRMLESDRLSEEILDLTFLVRDGVLEWDVPKGVWRIFLLYFTRNGGGDPDYINMLDGDSCRVLLDAVYEKHYERYGQEFGKTIAGFFSDEPCVGNTRGYCFDESIGRKQMPLPWSDGMPKLLEERLGADYLVKLTALFGNVGSSAFQARIRCAYMDAATRLISESFAGQLGTWCREHQVEYIGHIIEDGNMHSRLGCSQGHFFRALKGQHMAGIDDIGNQVLPARAYTRRTGRFGPAVEGMFYHYELGKLGSSLAHIDPVKQGRALCEIFGAYGWSLDTASMKYLVDHFLVRGINHFVPHAFSPKEYPDGDCPPHFYAHGKNPQYEGFGKLMGYLNRMCHLLNGGTHRAPAAVLYHGEAQWAGDCMFDQEVGRELLDHQIDFDILPADIFEEDQGYPMEFDGTLRVNGETYQALVIPWARYLPGKVLEFAEKAARTGYPVIFLEHFPEGSSSGQQKESWADCLEKAGCLCMPLNSLSSWLRSQGIWDVELSEEAPQVHYYHYLRDGLSVYLLQNEDTGRHFNGKIRLREKGEAIRFDVMEKQMYRLTAEKTAEDASEMWIPVSLDPWESTVLVIGNVNGSPADAGRREKAEGSAKERQKGETEREAERETEAERNTERNTEMECWREPGGAVRPLQAEWRISAAEAAGEPVFREMFRTEALRNYGYYQKDFSGYIRYETEFTCRNSGSVWLEIPEVFGNVTVFLNGKEQGMRIAPPWRFALDGIREGNNELCIQVATTLQRNAQKLEREAGRPGFRERVFPPMGILGQVWIREEPMERL
ncbi:MAG: hypothetical protein SOZ59_00795 [Candidatus Limivivens sp.]|nr:hypothetical protein [Candidatus Limivivens sp.]